MTAQGHLERGAILPLSLLLLLALTLLGLVSIRGTLLQTADLRQQVIRQQTFENAEAALREAEGLLAAPTGRAALAWDGSDGSYPTGAIDPWPPWQGSMRSAVAVNPERAAVGYVLERLGEASGADCDGQLYRVTAFSTQGDAITQVTLQATLLVPTSPGTDCIVHRTAWSEIR
jgi:type IV pilus assembly protein PilX